MEILFAHPNRGAFAAGLSDARASVLTHAAAQGVAAKSIGAIFRGAPRKTSIFVFFTVLKGALLALACVGNTAVLAAEAAVPVVVVVGNRDIVVAVWGSGIVQRLAIKMGDLIAGRDSGQTS